MSDLGDKEYYHTKRKTGKEKKRRNQDYNGKYSAKHVREQEAIAANRKSGRKQKNKAGTGSL